MIPRTLQIKNFLSYGPDTQTISFEPYHLICLSGKNGHGKSALLDAITWALWGTARKIAATARADQGLLHLGQTAMMVIFDFEVNGTAYRVKRCYEIVYGKPYTSLEFGIIQNIDTLVPLTDKTLRTTQACIDKTIGLDFDTFINSAFLRQGNANEFSKRSPKDRKEIITTILGLQSYDTLRKAASDKIKEATIQKTSLCAIQEKIRLELENALSIAMQSKEIDQALNAVLLQHTALLKKLSICSQEKEAIIALERKKDICELSLKQSVHSYEETLKELHSVRDAWRFTHKAHLLCKDPSALAERKKALLESLEKHATAQHTLLTLKEHILTAREALQRCTHTRESEEQKEQQTIVLTIERLKFEIQNYITNAQRLEQEKQLLDNEYTLHAQTLEANTAHITTLPDLATIIAKETVLFEKRKEVYQRFIAQGNMLRTELATTMQKMQLSHDKEDPSCPLCEQNLSATRRRFLYAKLNAYAHKIQHRCDRIKRIVPKLKQLLITQHATIQELQEKKALNDSLQKSIETTTLLLEDIAKKRNQINTLIQQEKNKQKTYEYELNEKQHLLKTSTQTKHIKALKDEEVALQTKLNTLLEQAHALQYDAAAHAAITQELKLLEQHISTQEALNQQKAVQRERAKTIAHLCAQLKEHKKKRSALSEELTTYMHLAESWQKLLSQEHIILKEIDTHAQEKERLLQEKGRLEAEQKKISSLENEYKNQQKMLAMLDEYILDYHAIAQAASKDGIQALLIEDAIPEIEQEANDILAKLTNNQAHISIESLRDLKKGGTKETLDINISDAAGIRPYELFSGGEAFRIDFALRIAISKLLARRSGTALQTLIIDEGFGSQDEEGLAHIMDAMYKIQDDFAKIIIVSHLSSMKDQFPVHFFIEKNARGSLVHVIEQG